jgi:uncharacterized protein YecE (DUF72 family)
MIRIGTSGYSFSDWKGKVYPASIRDSGVLSYYESELGFDTVEVNFTYYKLPNARTTEAMVNKVSDKFSFVVRSNKGMTHEIWSDDKRTSIIDNSEVFTQFAEGLKPMTERRRLACILLQFPIFFHPNERHEEYILQCKERLEAVPLVVEFRNSAWVSDRTFDFLKGNQLGFCIVDEPPLPRLVPYKPVATSDTAYFRFHGRNMKWFQATREERYNYLYSEEELKKFVPDIKKIDKSSTSTLVFFNNCHAGAAARNALMMKRFLGLVDQFSQGQKYAIGEDEKEPGMLF